MHIYRLLYLMHRQQLYGIEYNILQIVIGMRIVAQLFGTSSIWAAFNRSTNCKADMMVSAWAQ